MEKARKLFEKVKRAEITVYDKVKQQVNGETAKRAKARRRFDRRRDVD